MAFKIDDELINIIGDFANMNRWPDFKIKQKTVLKKTPTERQHSLNLAVGVSDERPPFSEDNVATTRQRQRQRRSTGKIFHPLTYLINNKRTSSAPAHMKDDNEQIQEKHGKIGNFPLNDKNNRIENFDLEVLPEEIVLLSSVTRSESIINHKKESMNNGDNGGVNPIILPPLSLYTNVGHRGSIVLIDDNDDKL
ncbi:unnamed protein product [Cercopithifilaria johnstoni]|uniref:Uncharacterized protein n=1 Tax=Cercopithifilaria johnstoni TaxID=2874296 RepID=A0A8J2MG20_9BILA|nr:unnamed protein product [Cercopithifilaria johnstoni]